jgi:cytochrome b561
MTKSTAPRTAPRITYDRAAQTFHWLTAALMLLAIMPIGIYAANAGDGPSRAYWLDHWHKPLGLLMIAITLARLVWKGTHAPVRDTPGLSRWEALTSHAAHWLLYGLLLAMPLSGLLMSQGAGRPTSFFGLFSIPQVLALDPTLAPRQQAAYKLGKLLHERVFDWCLYVAIALHVAGALKHRFVDGHHAYFRRMWGTAPDGAA